MLAEDGAGVVPAEGEFDERSFSFVADASHAGLLGSNLEIRLINANNADVAGVRGLEVDFDDIRLDAAAVTLPVPGTLVLGITALAMAVNGRRRRAA